MMQAACASAPGGARPNEDTVLVGPATVAVLDGLSAPAGLPMGCTHGTPWFVRQLGLCLTDRAADPASPLPGVLGAAIEDVNALHVGTCALDQEAVPAATVVMIRVRSDALDYLVLSDSTLVLDLGPVGVETVTDKRVEKVAQHEMRAALVGPAGSAGHERRVAELVAVQRRLRNQPGGYWVASTLPGAAEHALTGTVPLATVRRAALLTDGASRLADLFGILSWPQLLDVLQAEGPAALISRTREAERSDPAAARWPRFKRSDDATAAYVRIGSSW
ncbi:hypothetical protein WDH52_06395 [Streptomyces sp. TRM70308]|uniref:hypothetical protein n=1 Tax=Streptomyces sp. TRM70308 TaxID=3131932 RepID=UPI003D001CF6